MDAAAEERLQHYINGIGDVLGHPQRKEAFALYTLGLFSDLERKSVEPIVALTCPDPKRNDGKASAKGTRAASARRARAGYGLKR